MPTEHSSDVKFEIGHVLFIDIVGYSKLLINEQSEQIRKLKEIVRGTEQVRLAEAEASSCACQRATVARLFFGIARKRRNERTGISVSSGTHRRYSTAKTKHRVRPV